MMTHSEPEEPYKTTFLAWAVSAQLDPANSASRRRGPAQPRTRLPLHASRCAAPAAPSQRRRSRGAPSCPTRGAAPAAAAGCASAAVAGRPAKRRPAEAACPAWSQTLAASRPPKPMRQDPRVVVLRASARATSPRRDRTSMQSRAASQDIHADCRVRQTCETWDRGPGVIPTVPQEQEACAVRRPSATGRASPASTPGRRPQSCPTPRRGLRRRTTHVSSDQGPGTGRGAGSVPSVQASEIDSECSVCAGLQPGSIADRPPGTGRQHFIQRVVGTCDRQYSWMSGSVVLMSALVESTIRRRSKSPRDRCCGVRTLLESRSLGLLQLT